MENKKTIPAALCLVGIVFIIYSLQYKIGTINNPKDGFFPVVIAFALVCLSLFFLLKNLYFYKKTKMSRIDKESKEEFVDVKKLFELIGVLITFALIHRIFGYWITVLFAMTALLRIAGVSSWKWSLFGGIVTMVTGYIIFEHYMGAFFPKGSLWSL